MSQVDEAVTKAGVTALLTQIPGLFRQGIDSLVCRLIAAASSRLSGPVRLTLRSQTGEWYRQSRLDMAASASELIACRSDGGGSWERVARVEAEPTAAPRYLSDGQWGYRT